MRVLHSVTALFAAALMMTGAASATGFLEIKALDGETAENSSGFEGQIEVLSWSWGESASSSALTPRPSRKGEGIVHVTFKRDFSGRQAMRNLYDGNREIPTLILTTQEQGKAVTYKLDHCFIKTWSTSGDADDRPTEEVSFYYNKIAFSYAKSEDGKRF